MEHEKSPLYIPMGLKEEAEIFPGFGKMELVKSLIVIAVFAIADAVIFAFMQSIQTVIIVLILGVAIGIGLFVKDNTNSSVADKLADVIQFSRSRKSYPYIQKDEWGQML